jgi:hypothetical protein
MNAITSHTRRCGTCGYYGPYYCATAPRSVRVVRRPGTRVLTVAGGGRHSVRYSI